MYTVYLTQPSTKSIDYRNRTSCCTPQNKNNPKPKTIALPFGRNQQEEKQTNKNGGKLDQRVSISVDYNDD